MSTEDQTTTTTSPNGAIDAPQFPVEVDKPVRLSDDLLMSPRDLPIGGQAVMEGVMMRGVSNWAVAVRLPGDKNTGETPEGRKRRKTTPLGGEKRRRHAMDGSLGQQHARPAQPIVPRHDHQIEAVSPKARVLDVRGNRPSAAGALDGQRRAHRVAAAANHGIGPGRLEARTRLPGARLPDPVQRCDP